MLLLLHVVYPTIGNNRHNRDILDSNNHSAFFLISPNTSLKVPFNLATVQKRCILHVYNSPSLSDKLYRVFVASSP